MCKKMNLYEASHFAFTYMYAYVMYMNNSIHSKRDMTSLAATWMSVSATPGVS